MGNSEISRLAVLFKKYASKDLYADEEFIYKVLDIVLKANKISEYVSKVKINEDVVEGASAYYDSFSRVLQLKNEIKDDDVLKHNVTMLHVLLHECEHIIQHKICDQGDSTKKIFLQPCFKLREFLNLIQNSDLDNLTEEEQINIIMKTRYYEQYGKTLHQMSECVPSERMAEIDSLKKILLILSEIGKDYSKDMSKNVLTSYEARKIMGYSHDKDQIICPTHKFFEAIDNIQNAPKLTDDFYKQLDDAFSSKSLEMRLYYGMPITKDEYLDQMLKAF